MSLEGKKYEYDHAGGLKRSEPLQLSKDNIYLPLRWEPKGYFIMRCWRLADSQKKGKQKGKVVFIYKARFYIQCPPRI